MFLRHEKNLMYDSRLEIVAYVVYFFLYVHFYINSLHCALRLSEVSLSCLL